MIVYTSRPWAWTQGSRSTPTSPKHNLTFTSRFDNGISVESYTWWNTRWVWPVKTSEFTHSKEGIGSTHQGVLRTYTTNFGVNNTSSKVDHCSKADDTIYQGIIYPWKGSQGYSIWRTLSDKIQQRNRWSTRDLMWASVLNQRKKNARASYYRTSEWFDA